MNPRHEGHEGRLGSQRLNGAADQAVDRDLLASVEAISPIYREAADMLDDGPPAFLDDAILAAAHREVGSRPVSVDKANRAKTTKWRAPLATAAVVVISSVAVLISTREKPELVMSSVPQAALAPAAEVSPAEAPVANNGDVRVDFQAQSAPTADAAMADKVQQAPLSSAPATTSKSRVSVAEDRKAPTSRERASEKVADNAKKIAQSPQAVSDAPQMDTMQADKSDTRVDEAPKSSDFSPAEPSKSNRREAVSAGMEVATAPAAPAMPAPMKPVPDESRMYRDAEMASAKPATPPPAPAMAPAPVMQTEAAPVAKSASVSGSVAYAKEISSDPEAWMKQIEEQVKQGRLEEARTNLEKFRQKYPHYKVPEPLLQKLKPAQN